MKFDFLNKKSVAYYELLSRFSESWEFDVKSGVKLQ
jgi:hypothetical protein